MKRRHLTRERLGVKRNTISQVHRLVCGVQFLHSIEGAEGNAVYILILVLNLDGLYSIVSYVLAYMNNYNTLIFLEG